MKRYIVLLLATVMLLASTSCRTSENSVEMEPEISQMKSICELAAMDCYYHNVAKFKQEDTGGFLWWTKDKNFWIEYSGIVKLGIDASLVSLEVQDSQVTVTIPAAKVLGCKVDSTSLNKDSYIVDKNSDAITAEDEVIAFEEAQKQLEESASNNHALLASAQQRVQDLLEDYLTNIGNAIGKEYTIQWVYLDEEGNSTSSASSASESETPSADTSDTSSVTENFSE